MSPEEQEFFERVYREVYPCLYRYATKQLGLKGFHRDVIPDLAEELIQDACHTAVKKIKDMTSSPNPPGWLMNTLKLTLRAFIRRVNSDNQRLLSLEDLPWELSKQGDDSVSVLADIEYADTMNNVRKTLSAEDLQLFEMVVLNHVSHRTAAEKFGITIWASQKRVERARKALRKILQ